MASSKRMFPVKSSQGWSRYGAMKLPSGTKKGVNLSGGKKSTYLFLFSLEVEFIS